MAGAPDSFTFKVVSSYESDQAFAFHQKALSSSSSKSYLWPRDSDEIKRFSERNELFGVWRSLTRRLVAICYVTLHQTEWQLGGVAVERGVQRNGIGTVLVRYALAHTIAYHRPWRDRQTIATIVHEHNQDPRPLLETLGFEHDGRLEYDEVTTPANIERNRSGKVMGDRFIFPQRAVRGLYEWFTNFDGNLGRDGALAAFSIPEGDVVNISMALKECLDESLSMKSFLK